MNQTNYYNSTNWKLNIQLNNYQKKKILHGSQMKDNIHNNINFIKIIQVIELFILAKFKQIYIFIFINELILILFLQVYNYKILLNKLKPINSIFLNNVNII